MTGTARRRPLRGLVAAILVGASALAASATTAHADATVAAAVVSISPNDTPAQIRAKAATVTPSPRQLTWQRMELTAFIHFGINTFTGREHGTGTENPDDFQPNQLDIDQWSRALRDAGFKMGHHDDQAPRRIRDVSQPLHGLRGEVELVARRQGRCPA
jgi:alpha-L-fucosidase